VVQVLWTASLSVVVQPAPVVPVLVQARAAAVPVDISLQQAFICPPVP
jgi:hypothetical protein